MRSSRLVAAAASFAVAAALLVVSPAAGAVPTATVPPAEAPPAEVPPAEVPLEGLLRVIPVEAPSEHYVLDETGLTLDTADAPEGHDAASHAVEVTLFTDDGAVVELTPGGADEQWGDLASGSRFEGAVAVPEEIADAVADEVALRGLDPTGVEAGAVVADVAATMEVALPVVAATIDPPGTDAARSPGPDTQALAAAPRAHTLDVVWIAQPGTLVPSTADLQAAVGRLSEFWVSQSAGQISGITVRTSIQFRTVADPCAEREAWTYGAAQFGRSEQSYWNGTTASHLVVLAPAAVCGAAIGLGTYGAGVHAGGMIWGTIEVGRPAEWDQVLFHEFGHNVGLPHSNLRVCEPPVVDSPFNDVVSAGSDPDCDDIAYQDRYDVMGGGSWVTLGGSRVVSTMRDIPALSVTHKAKLDALPRGTDLRTLTIGGGTSQIVELGPASAESGLRGLELVDALTGERVFVEYRSGTGRDARSLYAQWPGVIGTTQFAPGVRVLRSIPDSCAPTCTIGYSTVLQRHAAPGPSVEWLGTGDSQVTYTGAVAVTVLETSPDRAVIEVTFRDTPLEFSALASPTVTGSARWGSTLALAGTAADDWTPSALALRHQWLRGGTPIPGATRSTYRLGQADIGAAISARVTAVRPGFLSVPIGTPPVTVTAPTTSRVSGATRYDTAVAVSRAAFPTRAPVVYLATGVAYPDALSAAPAAAAEGGPLLLTPASGSVPRTVLDRIAQLDPDRIVVVGGTGAVSAGVVAQVQSRVPGASIERLSGPDRYSTGREIIGSAFSTGSDIVYVATGRNYPDALSASAAAASRNAPVVLVDGSASGLDEASCQAITALAPSRIIVVGGESVVSSGIAQDLAIVATVTRLSGPSRFETSAAINREAFPSAPPAGHFWATGLGFPDALSGVALASANDAPLFVVRPGCVPPEVAAEAGRTGASKATLIGGTGVLFASVAALRVC